MATEQDELLVELVSTRRVLYDPSDKNNEDTTLKDNNWLQIAEIMNRPVQEIKNQWKNIRDHYVKKRKQLPTGSAAPKKQTWSLFERLHFLNSVPAERESMTNINDDESTRATPEQNVQSGIEAPNTTPKETTATSNSRAIKRKTDTNDELLHLLKKRDQQREKSKNDILQQLNPEKNDSIHFLGENVKCVLRTLSPRLLLSAKQEINNLLIKYETENLNISLNSEPTPSRHYIDNNYSPISSVQSPTPSYIPTDLTIANPIDESSHAAATIQQLSENTGFVYDFENQP